MAKWCGKIGYVEYKEVKPGIYDEQITERTYFGDVISDRRNRQSSGEVNDNINIANVFSIVADPFANQNCSSMAYIEYMGAKWKITNIEVQFPRLLLTVGGVYNGKPTETTGDS